MTPEMLSHLVVGAILLFFGRRLFWLFVGAVGFLSGFELAEQLFGVEPGWVAFAVGLLVGGAAAVLAMFFQLEGSTQRWSSSAPAPPRGSRRCAVQSAPSSQWRCLDGRSWCSPPWRARQRCSIPSTSPPVRD
jgi:uncharacterized membrane protein YuzA (DUF378 family)